VEKIKVVANKNKAKHALKIKAGPAMGMPKKKLKAIRKKLAPFIAARKAYAKTVGAATKKYLVPYKKEMGKARKPLVVAQKKYLAAMHKAQKKYVAPMNKIVVAARKKFATAMAKARKTLGIKQFPPVSRQQCVMKMCRAINGKLSCKQIPCQGGPLFGPHRKVNVVRVMPVMKKPSKKMMKAMRRKVRAFRKMMGTKKGKAAVMHKLKSAFRRMMGGKAAKQMPPPPAKKKAAKKKTEDEDEVEDDDDDEDEDDDGEDEDRDRD